MRKPEVFKMACLRDIRRLFGKTSVNPFYAGFGNRITDALSYRSVDVPSSRIFTINSTGEVKMELLELAGYKSSYVIKTHLFSPSLILHLFVFARVRYIHMTDLVDQMFPPIHRHMDAHFTDFNFWRPPMDEDDLPELTPPSPTLSARSDTSNQSTLARLRNMSLMGSSRTGHRKRYSLPPPTTEASIKGASKTDGEMEREPGTRDSHLRQMSSFERLSNTLSNFVSTSPSATSPASSPSDSEDEDEDIDLEQEARGRIRIRRTSMPGSLPGNSDDERDEHEHGDEEGEEVEEEDDYDDDDDDEHEEQRFDEDIFATGEMENVPFL